jgi:hypothetical protein
MPLVSFAQNVDDLKKQIILGQKKLNVMENVPLTDEEEENFWPIYGEYQEQLFELKVMRSRVLSYYVANYESLTDQQATNIMDNMFDLVDDRQDILKKFTLDLEEVLPAKKVFRYLQVENNIAAVEQYNLAKNLPLLE